MRVIYSILITLVFVGCKEIVARKPISVKTGTFFKESIQRNKQLLALEQKQIQQIIKTDTINTYYKSDFGFWYYYNTKDSLEKQTPQTEDIVTIAYDLQTLKGEVIYPKSALSPITFKVDKEALFPGLRNAIKLLKQGETATFLFPSSLGYGYHGDEDKIKNNTPLKSRVSLLELKKEPIN